MKTIQIEIDNNSFDNWEEVDINEVNKIAVKGKKFFSNIWVPISDRLPDKPGEYLVTYHPCYWDNIEDELKVGMDTFRGKTTWARNKFQKVVAWRELPAPYQEESPMNID